ncbi:three-Cys-motif partner protein TcmP [Saccharicrinis sp. FJH54]|uniref:three-Cys-motif partner protein TcmP n=1 Tax=Saccharicrinis sp. FJH54 TaxID=3344665 RepID=UPI0035D3EC55
MNTRIDLNSILNPNCKTNCNKEKRKNLFEDDFCSLVTSVSDDLPVRCVGDWGQEKIYLLVRYLDMFATSMHNKWKVNYIEICSGPGRCIDRRSGQEFDGSSLAILKHKAFRYLNKALFIDIDEGAVSSLSKRIDQLNINNASAKVGDYNNSNQILEIISSEINDKSLNFVFVDPTDCSVPFYTIKNILKNIGKVDILVNVASGTDFNRNIKNAILRDNYSRSKEKYNSFLGDRSFFDNENIRQLAEIGDDLRLRTIFRKSYTNSLKNLGYLYSGMHQIRHYYDLVFASQNSKALEFWNKAKSVTTDGQRTINF